MSPIGPFTSFGLLESVWLIGGVFSALKAFGWKRRLTESPDHAPAELQNQEVGEPSADRPPVLIRPHAPVPPKAEVQPHSTASAQPKSTASAQPPPVISDTSSGIEPAASIVEELGLQILVAEDNPINRKVMQLLLRRMGYEADIAIDGQQAVEMAIAKSYDAILMDLHMPRMGGIEATEAIIAQLAPPPRVVAVTADVTQQARAECQRVGMVAYLTKPVDSNLLLHELKEAEAHRTTFGRTG